VISHLPPSGTYAFRIKRRCVVFPYANAPVGIFLLPFVTIVLCFPGIIPCENAHGGTSFAGQETQWLMPSFLTRTYLLDQEPFPLPIWSAYFCLFNFCTQTVTPSSLHSRTSPHARWEIIFVSYPPKRVLGGDPRDLSFCQLAQSPVLHLPFRDIDAFLDRGLGDVQQPPNVSSPVTPYNWSGRVVSRSSWVP